MSTSKIKTIFDFINMYCNNDISIDFYHYGLKNKDLIIKFLDNYYIKGKNLAQEYENVLCLKNELKQSIITEIPLSIIKIENKIYFRFFSEVIHFEIKKENKIMMIELSNFPYKNCKFKAIKLNYISSKIKTKNIKMSINLNFKNKIFFNDYTINFLINNVESSIYYITDFNREQISLTFFELYRLIFYL